MYKYLFLFLFACCGSRDEDPRMFFHSNPIFDGYKAMFQAEYANHKNTDIYLGHIPINLSVIGGATAGKCDVYNSFREILIDANYWNTSNSVQKEILIFHELGHCALNIHHKPEVNRIMHKLLPNHYDYSNYREQYLFYLFN